MKIRCYPIDVTYKVINGKAVVMLYCRAEDGGQVCIADPNFKPYFYVIAKSEDAKRELEQCRLEFDGDIYTVTGIEAVMKKVREHETQCLRVYANLPSGIPHIREFAKNLPSVKDTFEYDIKYGRRYLMDKGITPFTLIEAEGEQQEKSKVAVFVASSVMPAGEDTLKPKVLALDIEVYNQRGDYPSPEKDPIVMAALYGDGFVRLVTWKEFRGAPDGTMVVKDEAELIRQLQAWIEEYQPDILAGYYSDGFDLPYIKKRAAKHNVKFAVGLDNSEMRISTGGNPTVAITGLCHIDVLAFIRRVIGRSMKTDSYQLDAVAKELLGESKHDVDVAKLGAAWDANEGLDKYARYNIQDSKLTYDLCMKVLPNLIELVKIVALPAFDVNRMSFSQLVEWFIIRQTPATNEVILNKPGHQEEAKRGKERFKGAFVFEPTPGLYNDIVVFDYRSLYPSIIASHNISIGTLNCECCKGVHMAPTDDQKYWFCTRMKGFVATIIEDLITRRARIKEIIKQGQRDPLLLARSEALKVLANAFYGYLGFAPARWYCFECGESVTAYGRHYIKTVIRKAQEAGFTVLYSDTDSVFLALGRKRKEDAMKFVENINHELPGLMELDYENFYPHGLFVSLKASGAGAKKKYALIDEKGILKIRGFETVRRNWSFIAKDTQAAVLEMALKGEPEKAAQHVRTIIKDLKANRIPLDKVVIHTQLQRDIASYESVGPHVAAAKRMQDRGTSVGPGSIIKYVVIKGPGKIRDKVRLADEALQSDYDAEYYIHNQIVPGVERILSVLGYSIEDMEQGTTQASLGSFG